MYGRDEDVLSNDADNEIVVELPERADPAEQIDDEDRGAVAMLLKVDQQVRPPPLPTATAPTASKARPKAYRPSKEQLERQGIFLSANTFFDHQSLRAGWVKNVSTFSNAGDELLSNLLGSEHGRVHGELVTELNKMLESRD
eukprot:6999-Eustigmatos_ZCMA.PRE.1